MENPPFSPKERNDGLKKAGEGAVLALNDPFSRLKGYGASPKSKGDYVFVMHMIKSLDENTL